MQREFKLSEVENVAKEFLDLQNSGVIGFSGNLGAGKTTFTKEILKQLGHEGNVISPTFVLRRDYEVRLTPNPSPLERGAMRRIRTSDLKNYENLNLKAKEMRKNPTEAEAFLWECLRGKMSHCHSTHNLRDKAARVRLGSWLMRTRIVSTSSGLMTRLSTCS